MSNFKEFLANNKLDLKLSGPPNQSSLTNLTKLNEMGILNEEIIWEAIGHAPIDPLFIIRTVRAHKDVLGFNKEEAQLGSMIVFFSGPKHPKLGYKVSYKIDAFTNDIAVIAHDGSGTANQTDTLLAERLMKLLENLPAGKTRLDELIRIIKQHVSTALAY